jgi:hypothetical protein
MFIAFRYAMGQKQKIEKSSNELPRCNETFSRTITEGAI